MRKVLGILLIVVLMAGMLLGCAPQETKEADNEVNTMATPVPKDLLDEDTDALGNEVEAVDEEQAQEMTIVSTAPSATEILFALGCGENIVGIDGSSTFPAETADIDKVGDFNGFDIEKVIALEPSVVFAGNGLQVELITALEDAGLNVVAVEATYYEDIAASITLIGKAVGKEAEAEKLNADMDAAEKIITDKTAEIEQNPSVYYVMGIGEYGNWTSGEGSFINTVIEMAGGVCTTAGSEAEWMKYPLEDLAVADPDILIVSELVTEADLLADPGYKDLTAIQNGTYYFINPDITERPGPRITLALEEIQGYIIGE